MAGRRLVNIVASERTNSLVQGGLTVRSQNGLRLPELYKEIDQEKINNWAAISGDFNRLHVDPEYARTTSFGGTIAHGPMALAFLNELMMSWAGAKWAIGGRLLDVRFKAPIRPGERIKISGTIKGNCDLDGKPYTECEVYVQKPDGILAVVGRAFVPF